MRVFHVAKSEARLLREPTGVFMKPVLAVLLLCMAAPSAVQASVSTPKHVINLDSPEIGAPDPLVERFLEAVDRGELNLFGQTLDRAMVVPARIEYVFDLFSRTTRIKVYSNLKAPMPAPGQTECHILGVSAVMEDGTITEIESHVWIKP